RVVSLFVPVPDRADSMFLIHAEAAAPGADVLMDQVDGLLASNHYEPALNATDGMDAAAAATAAKAALDRFGDSEEYACFPREPGASRHATIRRLPGYSELRRPLPVTCSTKIEGMALELWKMTLTSAWKDGPGRTAASHSETLWVSSTDDWTEQTARG